MSKEDDIKKEISKLKKIFSRIPDDKKKLVEGLIQNAAFMKVTLLELQNEINEHGAMIQGVSGNGFETIKDNPAHKAYTTMVSRYSGVINQLSNMLPSEGSEAAKAQAGNKLLEAISKGKPKVELR